MSQVVKKAMSVLEALGTNSQGLGVTELSHQVGLDKATTHRLLKTFSELGYVRKDNQTNKYMLDFKILSLGYQAFERGELGHQVVPFLQKLAMQVNESVYLAVENQGQILYINRFLVPRMLTTTIQIGRRGPMYCTALGKVLIAYCGEDKREKIIQDMELKKFTDTTIYSPDKLREHLIQVHNQGYAFNFGEHYEDIYAVAAPIFNHTGQVVAAMSITGPASRLTPERLSQYAPLVVETAQELSSFLGYRK